MADWLQLRGRGGGEGGAAAVVGAHLEVHADDVVAAFGARQRHLDDLELRLAELPLGALRQVQRVQVAVHSAGHLCVRAAARVNLTDRVGGRLGRKKGELRGNLLWTWRATEQRAELLQCLPRARTHCSTRWMLHRNPSQARTASATRLSGESSV